MRASKKILVLTWLTGLAFGAGSLIGQNQPSERKSEISLQFKTRLFMTPSAGESVPGKSGEPEIVLFARNGDDGLGKTAAQQLENLRKFFRLPSLTAEKESGEVKMVAENWNELKQSQPKAACAIRMTGKEYSVFVTPVEINDKEKIYRFRLEIFKNQPSQDSSMLKAMSLILSKEILWNYGGPLAVGFFSDEKAGFVTITIEYGRASFGGSIGASICWTL
jgi:hypothetical protein